MNAPQYKLAANVFVRSTGKPNEALYSARARKSLTFLCICIVAQSSARTALQEVKAHFCSIKFEAGSFGDSKFGSISGQSNPRMLANTSVKSARCQKWAISSTCLSLVSESSSIVAKIKFLASSLFLPKKSSQDSKLRPYVMMVFFQFQTSRSSGTATSSSNPRPQCNWGAWFRRAWWPRPTSNGGTTTTTCPWPRRPWALASTRGRGCRPRPPSTSPRARRSARSRFCTRRCQTRANTLAYPLSWSRPQSTSTFSKVRFSLEFLPNNENERLMTCQKAHGLSLTLVK